MAIQGRNNKKGPSMRPMNMGSSGRRRGGTTLGLPQNGMKTSLVIKGKDGTLMPMFENAPIAHHR